MRSSKTSLPQKLLLVFVSLVLSVVLIELGLRAASLVRGQTAGTGDPERIGSAVPNEYSVLALGESTTRGFGQKPFPMILEEELNARPFGRRFRVVNAGYTSQPSLVLSRLLPNLIERVDPHMVVLMLGINDQFYFSETEPRWLGLDAELLLLGSHFYKLLRLVWFNLWARIGGARVDDLDAFRASFERAYAEWMQGSLANPEQRFLDFVQTARESGRRGDSGLEVPDAYLRYYLNAYLALGEVYLGSQRTEEAIALYEEAIELHPDSEFFQRALSGVYSEIGEPELAAVYRERSQELADRRVLHATRIAFRELRETLAETDLEIAVMQYPLRPLAPLARLWGNDPRVRFVDNEAIFRMAIARSGYDALFIDRFAGDFGHCTEDGNRLIAANLLETVFEPIFGGSPATRQGTGSSSHTRAPTVPAEIRASPSGPRDPSGR